MEAIADILSYGYILVNGAKIIHWIFYYDFPLFRFSLHVRSLPIYYVLDLNGF
jgi:hypothetical protein